MTMVYHGIPEDMEGTKLVPLNVMFARRPDLYEKYLEKYKGREEILERRIPLLDCLWNDVVQLLPLHPRQLFELQQKLGLIEQVPDYHYNEIDASVLDSTRTVVYFKTAPGEENITVKWLKDVNVDELQEIPAATVEYYESMVNTGETVFNYQFVPHIVYMGDIDISSANTITTLL
jgi:hypothetical protein